MGSMWEDQDWEEKTKHINYTLDCFDFWGSKVGLIGGHIKEKYGETRWYANICGIESLHDILNVGHYCYKWNPNRGKKYIVLDFLNNWSMFFFGFWPICKLTIYWQVFFYNVAYWLPMLRYPGRAYEILIVSDYPDLVWFGRKYAKHMGFKLGTLNWLKKREKDEYNKNR